MLDLMKLNKRSETPTLVLGYKADGDKCELDSPDKIGEIKTWLKLLTGKDDRRLLNKAVKQNRKGRARFTGAGDTAAERFMASIDHIEGMGYGDQELSQVQTRDLFDMLPNWYIVAVREKLAEMNGEEDDDLFDDEGDGEGEGESDGPLGE